MLFVPDVVELFLESRDQTVSLAWVGILRCGVSEQDCKQRRAKI